MSALRGLVHFVSVLGLAVYLAGPASLPAFAEDTILKKASSEKVLVVEKVTEQGLVPVETSPAPEKKEGFISKSLKKLKAFFHRPVLKTSQAERNGSDPVLVEDMPLAISNSSPAVAAGEDAGDAEGTVNKEDPAASAIDAERMGGTAFMQAFAQNAMTQLMTKPPKQRSWNLEFDDGQGSVFQVLASSSKLDPLNFVAVVRFQPESGQIDQLIISKDGMPKAAVKGFGGGTLQGKIKDGILKINGIAKEVDLNNFDAELQFFAERIEASTKVEVPVPDSMATASTPASVQVDLGDLILKSGLDLVEDARAHTQKYLDLREDPANTQKIVQGLKLGQSFVLQGSPKTGKTSAIHDFARKVAFGLIPGVPRTLKLIELTPDELIAASIEGQQSLETVMKGLVAAAHKTGCIFVVENIRFLTMIPTKDGKSQMVDAFDCIRTEMRKGEVIFIGTENTSTAKSDLAVLPSFRELFRTISLEAPTAHAREGILAQMIGKRFGVVPGWDVIQAAISAADEYEPTVSPVDSAFALLVDAMAAVKDPNTQLTATDVLALAKARYKVPAMLLSRETKVQALKAMDTAFATKIVGRKQAVNDVKKFWQRALFPVQNSKLVNAVLLAGARESGKKEILKTSALALGFKPTVIQMADYATPESLESFYLKLAHALDKTPFQLFILEGIERADMSVQEAILKILEKKHFQVNTKIEGIETLWESEMREVKFNHAQISMTTTEGARFIQHRIRTEGKVDGGILRLAIGETVVEEAQGQMGGENVNARVAKLGIHNGILRAAAVSPVSLPTRSEFKTSLSAFIDELLKQEGASKKVTFEMVDLAGLLEKLSSYFSPNADGIVATYWDSRRLTRVVEDAISEAQMSQDFVPGATIQLNWDKNFDPGMADIPIESKLFY